MFEICEAINRGVKKTITYFETKLCEDGSYGDKVTDLACYYKSPMMFIIADKRDQANKMLNYISTHFMHSDGNFMTTEDSKSVKPEYTEFWSYTNGWIVRAAQLLGRSDIVEPGYAYLQHFYQEAEGRFITHAPDSEDGISDVLTTAHHGLLNLERENMPLAIKAGEYLCEVVKRQPDLNKGFYLRTKEEGSLIIDFDKEMEPFYFVNRTAPDQLYFMIGYPIAYLGLLYKSTSKQNFLDAANAYADFALSCHESVYVSNFSHKLAWALSILYSITENDRYLKAIDSIVEHFLHIQSEDGMWYLPDVNTAFDQSAEIACWLLEIQRNLMACKET